jgi:hypothetical protein
VFDIVFPAFADQKYYNVHFKYVLNIFKHLNCRIEYEKRDGFVITVDGKPFLIDYADTSIPVNCALPVFKFHCHKETPKLFSFPPVSFYNWNEYDQFKNLVKYPASGDISYRQRAYGNAKERRNFVKQVLSGRYANLKTGLIGQKEYWYEINNLFVALFVPGWCNNILDRAQFQYMAFGCCTISPRLPEILPFGRFLIPNEHYVLCKDDYSDITDLIDFYTCCPETCIEIGNNAKTLFEEVATPGGIGKWITSKL